jgi:hypothetical protein
MNMPVAIPMALFLADADVQQTLKAAFSSLSDIRFLHTDPLPSEPFLALVDAMLPDLTPCLSSLSGQSGCGAILLLGALPLSVQTSLPLRVQPLPVRLGDLPGICRTVWSSLHQPRRLLAPGLYFDPRGRLLVQDAGGERVELTAREAELFSALLEAGEAGLAREDLLRDVWGYASDLETHTLETHIYRLRQKIEKFTAVLQLRAEQGRYTLA